MHIGRAIALNEAHEPRDDGLAGTVHNLVGHEPAFFRVRQDPMDPVTLDEKVDGDSVQLDVP